MKVDTVGIYARFAPPRTGVSAHLPDPRPACIKVSSAAVIFSHETQCGSIIFTQTSRRKKMRNMPQYTETLFPHLLFGST